MKDKESVLKALNCCQREWDMDSIYCGNCPYLAHKSSGRCKTKLHVDAIKILEGDQKCYEKGANDAWNLLKEIGLFREDGMNFKELIPIFGCSSKGEILLTMDPLEAIKLYEQYKSKVSVGDIMINKHTKTKVVVIRIEGESFVGLALDGSTGKFKPGDWENTNESVNIDYILTKLKG